MVLAPNKWHDSGVPMNEQCKHFQSRTYTSGEVARFCQLDLAPEAPWRCPENCPSYAPRLADVGWVHGSLVEPPIEDEPDGDPEAISSVLDSAEEIVNEVAPDVLRDQLEIDAAERRKEGRRWWRFGR
jgi:hypothetical protein